MLWHDVLLAVAMVSTPPPVSHPADSRVLEGPALSGEVEDMCLGTGRAPVIACNAFLRGAFEGLMFGAFASDEDLSFCLPDEGVQLHDVRDTFLAFVLADPERRQNEAGMSLLESLEARYPCSGDDGSDLEVTKTGSGAPAGIRV